MVTQTQTQRMGGHNTERDANADVNATTICFVFLLLVRFVETGDVICVESRPTHLLRQDKSQIQLQSVIGP